MSHLPPAIFLMGPTASGKTGLAVKLKQQFPLEIISVDSALVYRGMNIGTAKPDDETLAKAPHHLIDLISPTEAYSAASFRRDALKLMQEVYERGNVPLLVGGTMLYFSALEEGLSGLPQADPDLRATLDAEAAILGWPAMHAKLADIDPITAARLKPTDAQRIQRALEVFHLSGRTMSALFTDQQMEALPYRLLKIGLMPSERKILHERIALRFQQMLSQGLIEEVRQLLTNYPALHANMPSMRCVGYRQVLGYLRQEYNYETMLEKGIAATRQLAKRQMTWLRSMPNTMALDCLDDALYEKTFIMINNYLK